MLNSSDYAKNYASTIGKSLVGGAGVSLFYSLTAWEATGIETL